MKIVTSEGVTKSIGEVLDPFGGILRCGTCYWTHVMKPGDAGRYTAMGWPKCCGYTATWWTQRQIDAGEMPEVTPLCLNQPPASGVTSLTFPSAPPARPTMFRTQPPNKGPS